MDKRLDFSLLQLDSATCCWSYVLTYFCYGNGYNDILKLRRIHFLCLSSLEWEAVSSISHENWKHKRKCENNNLRLRRVMCCNCILKNTSLNFHLLLFSWHSWHLYCIAWFSLTTLQHPAGQHGHKIYTMRTFSAISQWNILKSTSRH